MPIYEYECASCGKRFDQLQRLSDPDPSDCPTCGAPALKRAITAASFRLKGGGWYETDFKGDQDKKRNLVEGSSDKKAADTKSDGPAEAKSGASTESKSESKSETKTAEPAKAATTPTPAAPSSTPSTST